MVKESVCVANLNKYNYNILVPNIFNYAKSSRQLLRSSPFSLMNPSKVTPCQKRYSDNLYSKLLIIKDDILSLWSSIFISITAGKFSF